MIDCYFGIPSYKRPEKQATLEYLEKMGVPKEMIILTVQTETDYEEYTAHGYQSRARLIYRPGRNVSDNRNTIIQNVPRMSKMVILDDDIKYVAILRENELRPIEDGETFERFIRNGFAIARRHKTIGFSVYPVSNSFYMSHDYDVKNIGEGTLLGLINTGIEFNREFATKEDYELTCRIMKKYGAFPRLNNICCEAPHYTSGGCKENWDDTEERARTARKLVFMYPDLLKINRRKPCEVQMRQRGLKREY